MSREKNLRKFFQCNSTSKEDFFYALSEYSIAIGFCNLIANAFVSKIDMSDITKWKITKRINIPKEDEYNPLETERRYARLVSQFKKDFFKMHFTIHVILLGEIVAAFKVVVYREDCNDPDHNNTSVLEDGWLKEYEAPI